MDLNTLRSIVTVLAFLSFAGIFWWAYHRGARKGFDEAAQLPFAEGPAQVREEASSHASAGLTSEGLSR